MAPPDPLSMMERLCNLEDEPIPSFLSQSQGSSCANVTLGSTPGLPVAASTLAKVRPGVDIHNRCGHTQPRLFTTGFFLYSSNNDLLKLKFVHITTQLLSTQQQVHTVYNSPLVREYIDTFWGFVVWNTLWLPSQGRYHWGILFGEWPAFAGVLLWR